MSAIIEHCQRIGSAIGQLRRLVYEVSVFDLADEDGPLVH